MAQSIQDTLPAAVLLFGLLALAFAAGWMTDLRQHIARLIVGVILLVGLFAAFVLAVAVIQALAKDFLVPISLGWPSSSSSKSPLPSNAASSSSTSRSIRTITRRGFRMRKSSSQRQRMP